MDLPKRIVQRVINRSPRRQHAAPHPQRRKPAPVRSAVHDPTRRGVITPGILAATTVNPPLPRIKPQPIEITMTIFRRRRAQLNRYVATKRLQLWRRLLEDEATLERRLRLPPSQDAPDSLSSVQYVTEHLRKLAGYYEADKARARLKVPLAMVAQAARARKRQAVYLQKRARRRQRQSARHCGL
ncbi:uncharacterized protein L969DRAFT_17084 [Mixia osmundae IAM 14324]|uniref:Uncharacterized protein n=1 Tax=Mixia osmundae (strain CBS 9802 / IAM 14324 / JCM 22182 / KY 12970) TaxID=764103 RepID=G7E6F0_MIXOS|nr:uncharacterized protein L969DRAFT_17084 [Mixia osmundae IAM 14324]KEI40432.1 hypothetical protein L969DRAFT_17084 [Mixia osmundae IAM 14324]GAA98410.1 hypothetical protein E5Q_05096 [Mixia osmundae IAM 14324]